MDCSAASSSLRETFDAAMELPAEERRQWVERQCAQNPALRDVVLELLAAHERAGAFLADPTISPDQLRLADGLAPGTRIARYTLIRLLGQGGCGAVYLAEQDPPLRRHVALKLIRSELDGRQFVARFELERQMLVRLDHPNIAHILDAGSTDDDRPYFVMEFVDGRVITDFCREFELGLEARLALFVVVCDAVQHAHARGIFHRDLKPHNVLVAMRDGNPVPKVIDFGISQALGGDSDFAASAPLGDLHVLGTPQYMSPEQALRHPTDGRTDVYSLGALLYELLANRPPFDPSRLGLLGYEQMCQVLAQEMPPPPSTVPDSGMARFSALSADCLAELDRTVMRALSKTRAHRQQTPEALAADVLRCLQWLRAPQASSDPRASAQRRLRVSGAAALAAGLAIAISASVIYFRHRQATAAPAGLAPTYHGAYRPAAAGSGQRLAPGLVAELYRGSRFEIFISQRIDPSIHFRWPAGDPPDPRIPQMRYSIRWTGTIQIPPGGIGGMSVRADDGAQLFIDGNLLLEFNRPMTRSSHAPIAAGRHDIRIDYWNRLAGGDITLFWLRGSEDDSAEIVPAAALGHWEPP